MIKSHWQFIIRTALVSTLFFSTLIDGRTLTALAQIDTLIVAVAANSPPFAWKNEQGELTGFDIDIIADKPARPAEDANVEAVKPVQKLKRKDQLESSLLEAIEEHGE